MSWIVVFAASGAEGGSDLAGRDAEVDEAGGGLASSAAARVAPSIWETAEIDRKVQFD
jgi:hypothetical protein